MNGLCVLGILGVSQLAKVSVSALGVYQGKSEIHTLHYSTIAS